MRTTALVVHCPGDPFELKPIEVAADELQPDEVLVEMKATGICHTDLNFRKETSYPGLFPAVFGHEGAGIVIKIGSAVTLTSVGDHVCITYTCCGACPHCNARQTSYCATWEAQNFGVGRPNGSKAYSYPEDASHEPSRGC